MANINYVTGANGFLGSHLVKHLENVVAIPHKKILGTKLKSFDKFFFLSSYGNMFSQINDHKTIQANLLDLIHILEEAVKHKFNSFIYISTSSVTLPIQTMYSRTKKAAEEILLGYQKKYNLPIFIFRPFSLIGVGEQPKHLIPTLIRSCINKEKIPFVPYPRHDFVDVDDFIKGMFFILENHKHGLFEIGNGKAYSNQEVLELVQKCTGRNVNIEVVQSLRPYDNKWWVAGEIEWFKKLHPKTLKETIINMVIDYEQKTKNS